LREQELTEKLEKRLARKWQEPICYHCGEKGHVQMSCPVRKREAEELAKQKAERAEEVAKQKAERLTSATCFLCHRTGHLRKDCLRIRDKQDEDVCSNASTAVPLSLEELRQAKTLAEKQELGQALGPKQREIVERSRAPLSQEELRKAKLLARKQELGQALGPWQRELLERSKLALNESGK
jgi:hypothetical protein